MVYKSDALILRTYKLGEAERIVVFLTRDRGKKRGVAKGARRPKSRYTGALEPLTRGEVAYFELAGRQRRQPAMHSRDERRVDDEVGAGRSADGADGAGEDSESTFRKVFGDRL